MMSYLRFGFIVLIIFGFSIKLGNQNAYAADEQTEQFEECKKLDKYGRRYYLDKDREPYFYDEKTKQSYYYTPEARPDILGDIVRCRKRKEQAKKEAEEERKRREEIFKRSLINDMHRGRSHLR